MASLFNNLFYPLSIMLTMPQALVGALLASLDCPDAAFADRRDRYRDAERHRDQERDSDDRLHEYTLRARGYRRYDAILEAAPARLRPILMTSFCIIGSTLPTALALGRGAGFRQPLGITVVGGVLVSTFLTLFVIPCTYILFDDFSQWMGRLGVGRKSPKARADRAELERDDVVTAAEPAKKRPINPDAATNPNAGTPTGEGTRQP